MLAEERRSPGSVLDRVFIEQHSSGFDEFEDTLDRVEWSPILEQSGLTRGTNPGGGRRRYERTPHHLLLGDGHYPA